MRILSWNVNGLRAACKHSLIRVLDVQNADVICLQEIRLQEDQIPDEFLDFCNEKGYKFVASYGMRKGYAGTMTLYKGNLEECDLRFKTAIFPRCEYSEGRVIIAKIDGIKIINTYVVNSQREAARKEERLNFNTQLLGELKDENTILCGDLNAISQDIDIYMPTLVIPGNYDFERQFMALIIKNGYTDAFRKLHPKDRKFTWFPRYEGFEEANKGLRLDYFMVSNNMENRISNCNILNSYTSDHKPILLEV